MTVMGIQTKADPVSRATVEAFYTAFKSYSAEQIGPMLDDDIEWIVSGPVDVMKVCGAWHGKDAVVARFANLNQKVFTFQSLHIEHLLVDGDCSALFGRVTVLQHDTGRRISHRVAHIVRYRNGKVMSMRCICDSLDAAEQYLGRRIKLTDDAPALSDDIVAV